MAIDTPPAPPQYHLERVAPAAQADPSAFNAVSNAMKAVAERSRAAIMPEQSPLEKALPAIDVKSAALTQADRVALVGAMRANDAGDLSSNRTAVPNSYVGERIRLASAYAAVPHDGSDLDKAHQARCRMIALAMDRRAGAYVEGGEMAANRARASIDPAMAAECRVKAEAVRRETTQAQRAAKTRVDPELASTPGARTPIDPTHSKLTSINPTPSQRVRIDPVRLSSKQAEPVRLDLPAPHRVRIDFKPQERTRIDPGMGVQAARSAAAGRGV